MGGVKTREAFTYYCNKLNKTMRSLKIAEYLKNIMRLAKYMYPIHPSLITIIIIIIIIIIITWHLNITE